MFLAGGYEFGARLLGVSLRTYGFVHRTFAYVAMIEGIVYVIIIARIRTLSWTNHSDFYGLLVCFCSIDYLPLSKSSRCPVLF